MGPSESSLLSNKLGGMGRALAKAVISVTACFHQGLWLLPVYMHENKGI